MFEHFRFCEEFNYKLNLYRLADNGTVDHWEILITNLLTIASF